MCINEQFLRGKLKDSGVTCVLLVLPKNGCRVRPCILHTVRNPSYSTIFGENNFTTY